MPPELAGKCQACGHDMIKRAVPFTITEDFSALAGVRVAPKTYTVCETCHREHQALISEAP